MDRKTTWKLKKQNGNIKRKVLQKYLNIINNRPQDINTTHYEIVRNVNEISDGQARVENNSVGSSLILNVQKNQTITSSVCSSGENNNVNEDEGSLHILNIEELETNILNSDEEGRHSSSDDENSDTFSTSEYIKNVDFRNNLQKWAVQHNITQVALGSLANILNERIPSILPADPRTIMHTKRHINLKEMNGGGQYWHNGIIAPLTKILISCNVETLPESISLNFNFDGLPIHKSSKQEFWPILCNIFEIPEKDPFIIGIYYGIGKPKDLGDYLSDFVAEMAQLLETGIFIEKCGINISVTIRCFICDSPARAFIKGVCNFNGIHGCLKCTILGEYSHTSHTVTFPRTRCPDRTDEDFRLKKYGAHHKVDSPLLQLPIDMINDFPVSDSLHLIDLGIVKRLVTGWCNGNFGKYLTKWCSRDIEHVNSFLSKCKMPSEIHRAVRGLNSLAHWKGTEYRTFFYYLSVVLLPDVLSPGVVKHFLLLFCAITICSSSKYRNFLSLSKSLLIAFVEQYKHFYGKDYITSNVHNLTHVTDEVERLGPLNTFNAYPFENKLYIIKNMLRQGNKALSQVAKRLGESDNIFATGKDDKPLKNQLFQILIKKNRTVLKFKTFEISSKFQDKYFMTKNNEVVEFEKKSDTTESVLIQGFKFLNKTDLFDIPLKSSFLNIYKVSPNAKSNIILSPDEILCKLVCIEHRNEYYTFPLLHTLV